MSTSSDVFPVSLLERCLAGDNLQHALDAVVANDAEDGAPTFGVQRLVAEGLDGLVRHAGLVRSGDHESRPLTAVKVPKSNGGVRRLAVPAAADRVLERAVLQVVLPLVDPLLGPFSFAYRPGTGVGDAVRAVVRWRDEGFPWVVHTDIDDCFESIDRSRLRQLLRAVIADPGLLRLIDAWLERPIRVDGRLTWPILGVPQGSPLSPLWSNLYLADLDQRVTREGFPMVRYADDLLVFARTREEAQRALETTHQAADALGLRLGDDKTEIIDFATGFCFLGEDFNGRYPAMAAAPVEAPDRLVLYAGVQGAYASLRAGRLVVSRDKRELLSVPTGHVARIVVFGSVTLSPAVLAWALTSDVEVVFCSRRGSLLGTASPSGSTATATRRRQFKRSEQEEICVRIGPGLIRGKVNNQRVLLQRRLTPESVAALREPIAELDGYFALLGTAATRNELLGMEGIAARTYFGASRGILPDELGFAGRVIRPPGDVVNAALGYGYAVLVGECATALAAAGLDPSIGVLHTDRGARLSLALDLAEEFRPLIVDSVVVSMARGNELTSGHGRPVQAGKGVLLTEAGRVALLAALERRLLTRVFHLATGHKVSYRRSIFLQAQALAKAIIEPDGEYVPMLWRV